MECNNSNSNIYSQCSTLHCFDVLYKHHIKLNNVAKLILHEYLPDHNIHQNKIFLAGI